MILHDTVQDAVPPTGIKMSHPIKYKKMAGPSSGKPAKIHAHTG
jgi:hypothetical protein